MEELTLLSLGQGLQRKGLGPLSLEMEVLVGAIVSLLRSLNPASQVQAGTKSELSINLA